VVETEDFLPEITFQYGIGKGLPPEEAGAGAILPQLPAGPPVASARAPMALSAAPRLYRRPSGVRMARRCVWSSGCAWSVRIL